MACQMMMFLRRGCRLFARERYHYSSIALMLLLSFGLTGCADVGAPSFILVGSFIPYWMVCAAVGLLVTIVARIGLIHLGIDDLLPLRLLVYVCLMLSVSFILSLLFFMG